MALPSNVENVKTNHCRSTTDVLSIIADYGGRSYPIAHSTSIVFLTAGRAITLS
jgi:hypothetical protein